MRALKRLNRLLHKIDTKGLPEHVLSLTPTDDTLVEWHAEIEGPPGTPYEGGVFLLGLKLHETYPFRPSFRPPRVRFVTPVYHCNITDRGLMCLDILGDKWTPALTLDRVVASVALLLQYQNEVDCLVPGIAQQYINDHEAFLATARRFTLLHATPCTEGLTQLLLGLSTRPRDSLSRFTSHDLYDSNLLTLIACFLSGKNNAAFDQCQNYYVYLPHPPKRMSAALKRLKRLLRQIDTYGLPDHVLSLTPTDDTLLKWDAEIEGPPGTPYEGGVFLLSVKLHKLYPFRPPDVRFVTPVYHCNITDRGQMWLHILGDKWTPALTLDRVLGTVALMLTSQKPDDYLVPAIAQQYINDHEAFLATARRFTLLHATPCIEGLTQLLLGLSTRPRDSLLRFTSHDLYDSNVLTLITCFLTGKNNAAFDQCQNYTPD